MKAPIAGSVTQTRVNSKYQERCPLPSESTHANGKLRMVNNRHDERLITRVNWQKVFQHQEGFNDMNSETHNERHLGPTKHTKHVFNRQGLDLTDMEIHNH